MKYPPIVSQNPDENPATVGQSGVKNETSDPNVVQVAIGSKDHKLPSKLRAW